MLDIHVFHIRHRSVFIGFLFLLLCLLSVLYFFFFLHPSGRHVTVSEVGKGVGLAVVGGDTGAGAGLGRESPRGAAAPGEGDGCRGALVVRNREEEDVSGGGDGREVERGGGGFNTRGESIQIILCPVFVSIHLQAAAGGEAQAGAQVGEGERDGLVEAAGTGISPHHGDGFVAAGGRDVDVPVLVRPVLAHVVGKDFYTIVFGASIGVVVNQGAVESGDIVHLEGGGFVLVEVAPGASGVFQGGVESIFFAIFTERGIQPHHIPLFPLRRLVRLHGAGFGQSGSVGAGQGAVGEGGLRAHGDVERVVAVGRRFVAGEVVGAAPRA